MAKVRLKPNPSLFFTESKRYKLFHCKFNIFLGYAMDFLGKQLGSLCILVSLGSIYLITIHFPRQWIFYRSNQLKEQMRHVSQENASKSILKYNIYPGDKMDLEQFFILISPGNINVWLYNWFDRINISFAIYHRCLMYIYVSCVRFFPQAKGFAEYKSWEMFFVWNVLFICEVHWISQGNLV